jgi:hypothetical protein
VGTGTPTQDIPGGDGGPADGGPTGAGILPEGAVAAGGMRDPMRDVPARRSGVVRRTMHIDIAAAPDFASPLALSGAARDLRTGPDDVTVLARAAVDARFDERRRLVSLETTPAAPWTADLLGARPGSGFRRLLEVTTADDTRASLLRQVLDDLPAGALISGYARMRVGMRHGRHPADLMPSGALTRMTDLCAGWRQGGIGVRSVRAGRGVPVQDTPPAPDLGTGDALAWHELDDLPPDWMRRRRLIDAERIGDGGFRVWAMFRDSVGEPAGGEVVLHEYVVRVEGVGRRITAIEAEPRVLPFPECRGAAQTVTDLCGLDIDTLAGSVPDVLMGIRSCTHLNDLLRSLAGAGTLLDVVDTG